MSRQLCPTCQRPTSVCYCSEVAILESRVHVLIIQHPLEVSHPFNTGRMASLCLRNSSLIVEESLTQETLRLIDNKSSALVYPSLSWLAPPTQIIDTKTSGADKDSIEQLVIIDSNWRKSKKVLFTNPELQQLPRIAFPDGLKSKYQIRKTTIENGLSTIESIKAALEIIEPTVNAESLMQPFKRMVELQLRFKRAKPHSL